MTEPGRDERDEARVREAFDALREHDAGAAPPFARAWAVAASRSRARPFALWLAAGAGAAATALAGFAAFVLWAGSPPTDGAVDEALAAHVAAMRSEPLAFAAALPTAGAFGGGGWFAADATRAQSEEVRSW